MLKYLFSVFFLSRTTNPSINQAPKMAENVASGYLPRYPDGGNPPDVAGIQSFITNFYQVSDDPKLNERWVDSFTEDATVQIGPDKVQGVEGT